MQGAYIGFTETYYCNSMGRVKSIVTSNNDGSSSRVVINSYGEYVAISAPEDSHLYVEMDVDDTYPDYGDNWGDDWGDVGLGEDFDPESAEWQSVYSAICDTLEFANSYSVFIDFNGEGDVLYSFNGDDKYIIDNSRGDLTSYNEAWYVDGIAYCRKGYVGTTVADTYFNDLFGVVEGYLDTPYTYVNLDEVIDVYLYEESDGLYVLELMIYDRTTYDTVIVRYSFDKYLINIGYECSVYWNNDLLMYVFYDFKNIDLNYPVDHPM
jgi:hypothetical protein